MAKGNIILENTGERMIPEFHKGSLIYGEHYIRYLTAQELTNGKVVLDIASGSGYGTKLLAKHAKKVYGIDVDKASVEYADKNFGASNIEYKVGDGEKIPLDDNSVDLVVTFETIEHVPNYKQFVKEIYRVLRPDGIAVVSTPNDLEFAEGNHFHLHEFKYNELLSMLKKEFKYIDPYFQATSKYVALGAEEIFNKEGTINVKTLNLSPTKPDEYLYFYMVCSNREIKFKLEPVAAVSSHYSDRQLDAIYNKNIEIQRANQEEIAKLTEAKKRLTEANKLLTVQADASQAEVNAIKSSKAYKLARTLSKTKSGLNVLKKSPKDKQGN